MRLKRELFRLGVFALASPFLLMASAVLGQNGPGGGGGGPGGGGGGGKLSQASLDLDTAGCPTTFGPPICEEQTEWTLEKTILTPTPGNGLDDPDLDPFAFEVTVTEGATTSVVSGSGQIVITNSGEFSAVLSSIVVNLEQENPGGGDAPGPGGQNWTVLSTSLANEAVACGNTALMCYGEATQSAGASLVLIDPDGNDVIALSDVLPIPATLDNDGDGERDEDPADGIDNDSDGQIDEDGACEDAVVINFEYSFDVSGMGLVAGESLRINLMATFGSAGSRGGSGASCTLDVNCNGVIDLDNPATDLVDEGEEDNIRTVQQRLKFLMPECNRVCETVTLNDDGAKANDAGCVDVVSDTIVGVEIAATGTEGEETSFLIMGTVDCLGGDCETAVTNTATLICDDSSLITGSPASASFNVSCMGEEPRHEVGDFCTQTQGGWGQDNNNDKNVAALRDANFDAVFLPGGLIIGDPDGPDADSLFALHLTNSAAVANYLPAGSTPGVLTADQTDPHVTSSGVFGGQLVAATINVAFDAAGIRKDGSTPVFPPGTLATLIYNANCVADALVGKTVADVIALANTAISGGGTPAGITLSDLNNALSVLNETFADCVTVHGCLEVPDGTDPLASDGSAITFGSGGTTIWIRPNSTKTAGRRAPPRGSERLFDR